MGKESQRTERRRRLARSIGQNQTYITTYLIRLCRAAHAEQSEQNWYSEGATVGASVCRLGGMFRKNGRQDKG